MEKREKKELLYSFIDLFNQGIKNEGSLKLLNNAIKAKLEYKENIEG